MTVGLLEREAASLFSSALFRPLAQGRRPVALERSLREYAQARGLGRHPRHTALADAYQVLQSGYRTEHVYKNVIATRIYLGRHRATGSALFQEFAMGGSVADCFFVNGGTTAYEIKTEYDTPARLRKQLEDYARVATKTYVVVHISDVERYLTVLDDLPTGLLAVNSRMRLSELQPATQCHAGLDVDAMFRTLRAGEAEAIVRRATGSVPTVPNGRRFEALREIAKQMDPVAFNREMANELRKRAVTSADIIRNPITAPVRAILVRIGIRGQSVEYSQRWLSEENT